MTRDEIIQELAKDRIVENVVMNIGHSKMTADLSDLAQEIYMILLTYDEDKIIDLWVNGEIGFFIARIAINQYRSSSSPFHIIYRKFRESGKDITEFDFEDERDC